MSPLTFLGRFTHSAALVLAISLGALLATALCMGFAMRHPRRRALLARLLLADSLTAVALFTLLPASGGGQAVNLTPGAGVNAIELGANAALFAPVGACAWVGLSRHRRRALVTLSLAVPPLIEVAQHSFHLGRISDVNDVLANASGALIGAGVAHLALAAARPRATGSPEPQLPERPLRA